MFEPVAIVCDDKSQHLALAIRAALEAFHLRVHYYHCVQHQDVARLLAGGIAACRYAVLATHGIWDTLREDEPESEMKMGFIDLVIQRNGVWEETQFVMTPKNIPELVHLEGRTVLSLGCRAGREPFARAFLDAGCSAYIAGESCPDGDAYAMFAIAFFYHLLSEERPGAGPCTEEEAAARAAAVDRLAKEGTHVYRYYGR